MFSTKKICPKCHKSFDVLEVKMSRSPECPHCHTCLRAKPLNSILSGLFLVVGLIFSEVISIRFKINIYIPVLIVIAITVFLIEPITIQYKVCSKKKK